MDERIAVVCLPGTRRAGWRGWQDGAARVAVVEPAQDGRANRALIRLIAEAADVPPSSVEIVSGHGTRRKVISLPSAAAARLRSYQPPPHG